MRWPNVLKMVEIGPHEASPYIREVLVTILTLPCHILSCLALLYPTFLFLADTYSAQFSTDLHAQRLIMTRFVSKNCLQIGVKSLAM